MSEPQPSAGLFVGREHRLAVRVYYEDTDFTGFVYHAGHVRFFERGRTDFLRATGMTHAALLAREDPCAFVVTHMSIDFHKAARIDDALLVLTTYDLIRGPRLEVAQRIVRGSDPVASAAVTIACIDPGSGAPRRPPKDLVERMRPLLLEAPSRGRPPER